MPKKPGEVPEKSELPPSALPGTLAWDDPSVRVSLLLVALTVIALLLRIPTVKLLVALLCSGVVLRALWGVWTLSLVRHGRVLDAVQRRMGMYLTGLLSVACNLALLFSMRGNGP